VSVPVHLVLFEQVRHDTPMNRAKPSERDGKVVLDACWRCINLAGGVQIEISSAPFAMNVAYLARVASLTLAGTWVWRITVST
jgi:hypothetical protein